MDPLENLEASIAENGEESVGSIHASRHRLVLACNSSRSGHVNYNSRAKRAGSKSRDPRILKDSKSN